MKFTPPGTQSSLPRQAHLNPCLTPALEMLVPQCYAMKPLSKLMFLLVLGCCLKQSWQMMEGVPRQKCLLCPRHKLMHHLKHLLFEEFVHGTLGQPATQRSAIVPNWYETLVPLVLHSSSFPQSAFLLAINSRLCLNKARGSLQSLANIQGKTQNDRCFNP